MINIIILLSYVGFYTSKIKLSRQLPLMLRKYYLVGKKKL